MTAAGNTTAAFNDIKLRIPILECASGDNLLDRVTSTEAVSEDQIAFFIRQLLQALQHIHSRNIVHLDIKPENIMLSESGKNQIKLVDFGLSRKLSGDTQIYGSMGTPEFVPPEVVMQKPVSLASDMWSVGVLAYVMLSGSSPFLGDSDNDTLDNVTEARWSFSPSSFNNVSSEAKDFISTLLVLDPRKRMTVNEALLHPWMQVGDGNTKDSEHLSTKPLKEFKYRHQWVERRIFMRTASDKEATTFRLKPHKDSLERKWLEPALTPEDIVNRVYQPLISHGITSTPISVKAPLEPATSARERKEKEKGMIL